MRKTTLSHRPVATEVLCRLPRSRRIDGLRGEDGACWSAPEEPITVNYSPQPRQVQSKGDGNRPSWTCRRQRKGSPDENSEVASVLGLVPCELAAGCRPAT